MCWSLFLIKVAGIRAASLLKRLQHRIFPINFAKILRTPFVHRTPPVAASESLDQLSVQLFPFIEKHHS